MGLLKTANKTKKTIVFGAFIAKITLTLAKIFKWL